jgi:hypothetical protein
MFPKIRKLLKINMPTLLYPEVKFLRNSRRHSLCILPEAASVFMAIINTIHVISLQNRDLSILVQPAPEVIGSTINGH